jgi:hypothetical protein
MTHLLAYTPFIDPIPAHGVWYLLIIPLTFLLAMAYKSVRVADIKEFWPNALTMWIQTLAGMIALAVFTWLLVEWLLPTLSPMAG